MNFDNYSNSKIPYDDIPISRGNQKNSSNQKNRIPIKNKVFVIVVTFLILLNGFMGYVTLNYIKNGKVKNVNLNSYTITTTQDNAETILVSSAKWSCASISAGGEYEYTTGKFTGSYTSGSAVLFRIDTSSTGTDAYFITCNHVVSKHLNDKIWIWLPSKLTPILATSVVGCSVKYDIAVIKYHTSSTDVDSNLEGCTPVKIFDTTYLMEGERIYAIGNPYSEGMSIKSGIISRLNKTIKYQDGLNAIEIDAPINPGNSGGGLFNSRGEFIGIVQSKYSTTEKVAGSDPAVIVGMSFAVPGDVAVGIATSMIQNQGNATQINLGATFSADSAMGIVKVAEEIDGETKFLEQETVIVSGVSYNSSAYGYLKVGDIVKSMAFSYTYNGETISKTIKFYNKNIFESYSFSIIKGSQIKFVIERKDTISSPYEIKEISFVVSNVNSVE